MKLINLLSVALVFSLGGAALASAAGVQKIRVAGSSTFREAVIYWEIGLASHDSTGYPTTGYYASVDENGNTVSLPLPGVASSAGNAATDPRSIVHGWLDDGDWVTPGSATEVCIQNNWNGSVAGVISLAGGNSALQWYEPATSTFGTTYAPYNIATHTAPRNELGAPDLAMSDVSSSEVEKSILSQGGNGFSDAQLIEAMISSNTLEDSGGYLLDDPGSIGPIAKATFQWVAGKSSVPIPFTNITQQQANSLITNGYIALNIFTGNPADAIDFVFFVGSNEASGTRIVYQAESQQKPQFGGAVSQWMVKQDALAYPASNAYASLAAGATVTGLKLWPKSWPMHTVSNLNWNIKGHSGYNDEADVVAILATNNPVTGFTTAANPDLPAGWVDGVSRAYFVSCLNTVYSAKLAASGGTTLSYNGVPFTAANAFAGKYSLYSTSHAYQRGSWSSSINLRLNLLADQLSAYNIAELGGGGIPDPIYGRRMGTGSLIW